MQLNINISQYPSSILNKFSDQIKNQLAEDALKRQDYEGLQHILKHIKYYSGILSDAISALDTKAIDIILTCKGIDEHVDSYHLQEVIDFNHENLASFLTPKDQLVAIRTKIFKLLITLKKNITSDDLQLFSTFASKEEFDQLCNRRQIDLEDSKYKELDIEHYKIGELKPLLILENGKYHEYNPLDTILSASYSSVLQETQLRQIYENLFTLDDISKEMLSYLAMKIATGDPIKIILEQGIESAYYPLFNLIKINTDHLNDPIFNIDSVIIHEIGHYFYDRVFNNNSVPISIDIITNFIKTFADKLHDPFFFRSRRIHSFKK